MQQLFSRRGDGDRPERPEVPAWLQPPQDELPVLLPVGEFLARTPGTALAVTHLEVYSTGVGIRVEAVVRRRDESDRDWSWLMHGGFRHREDSEDGQHWGVELSNGEVATLGSGIVGEWNARPDGWSLRYANGGGGGGGDDRYEAHHGLWLWPLPPAGPVQFAAEWRDRGIAQAHVTLDGDAILAAVPRVRPLWE
jgi:hypothetical protein